MDQNRSGAPASRWVFYHARFDRDVLVSCVERLLLDSSAKYLMNDLVEATTVDILADCHATPDSLRQLGWYNLSELRNYEWTRERPHIEDLRSMIETNEPLDCDLEPWVAIDLKKMFKMMPSAAGDFDLAAVGHEWQVLLDLIYSMAAVVSLILNAITVIVLWNCRRGELRKYLINLSVSDVLMSCFSLPFTYMKSMHGSWLFPRFLCPLSRFLLTMNVFVSVATMAVISINRHAAIMNPFQRKGTIKIRHWRVRQEHVIIGIWLLGIVIASPIYLMYRADMFCYNNRLYFECHVLWSDSAWFVYVIIINVSTFVLPLSILSFFYARIALKLWQHTAPGNQNANRDSSMQTQRIKTVKMLLMMVVAFVVTWLPIQTVPMVMYLMTHTENKFSDDPIIFYVISHWLSMAHSCCNPLIYCFMSERFRRDLRRYIFVSRYGCGDGGASFFTCLRLDKNGSPKHLRGLDREPWARQRGRRADGDGASCARHHEPLACPLETQSDFQDQTNSLSSSKCFPAINAAPLATNGKTRGETNEIDDTTSRRAGRYFEEKLRSQNVESMLGLAPTSEIGKTVATEAFVMVKFDVTLDRCVSQLRTGLDSALRVSSRSTLQME